MVSTIDTELLPSLFKTTVDAFKSGAREIGNAILLNVIASLKKHQREYQKIREDIEKDPALALKMDNEDFHSIMMGMEEFLEKNLQEIKKHENDSEIFKEYAKTYESLYDTVLMTGIEVAATAARVRHESKHAS